MSIALGSHDPDLDDARLEALIAESRRLSDDTSGRLRGDKGPVPFVPLPPGERIRVADVQQLLVDAGFFPGGRIDGICGYRTRAAIRLFQEYVRSIERRNCAPDGVVGPKTRGELVRWRDSGLSASWAPRLRAWTDGTLGVASDPADEEAAAEWRRWMTFLEHFKAHHLTSSDPEFRAIDAFASDTDTHRVADWRFSADDLHLIGIRYGEADEVRIFDDVLVLLVKGLVFEFQGSTDPGATSHPEGAPFMVRGQHDFRLGLHRGSYHALRPLHYDTHGVLVVRSRSGLALSDAALAAGLQINGTINVHWGGKGLSRPVASWSEGCQVVNGAGYRNHAGDIVDCTDHVAINNSEVADPSRNKTRGAYNVLADLIVALASDMPQPGVVRYTLLHASDLELDPTLAGLVSSVRTDAWRRIREHR